MDRERRKQYPANWEAISRQFRESKGFTCEGITDEGIMCGVKQGEERISRRTGLVYTVVVAAAHKHKNDTANPHAELICLCARCHWAYDHPKQEREEELLHEKRKHALVRSRRLALPVQACRETDGS